MHDEVETAELIQQLQTNIGDIHEQHEQINYKLNDGMKRVVEHCNKLRNEIKYTALCTVQKINQIGQSLVNQVNEYETACIQSFYEKDLKDSYNILQYETKCFDKKWSEYLKQTNIDYDQIMLANKAATEFKKKTLLEKNKYSC